MSLNDMWCMYSRETGLPPTGPAYRLVSHVISRFSTPCSSCNGEGSKALDGKDAHCVGCGGFRRYLSPAAIRRAHQIVRATFPSVASRERTQEAARGWTARAYQPPVAPMYLGRDPLPLSVTQAPPGDALPVASITWRRGLRAELLWTADGDLQVLWERLPDLLLPTGEPWVEVFSWIRGPESDAERSAQRLLRLGWSEMNPAYGWLGACRAINVPPFRAFSVTAEGLLKAAQLDWLFLSAARVRREDAKREAAGKRRISNIGPYSFGARPQRPPQTRPGIAGDEPEGA